MHWKDFTKGALLGALGGFFAGILLAPKSGRETREDIKNYLREIKDKVAAEVSELATITREKYNAIVESIVGSYEESKKMTDQEAAEIKKELRNNYSRIREILEKP